MKLGRVYEYDARIRNFPLRSVMLPRKQRSMTWLCSTYLDQGDTASCVGHAICHDAIARPDVERGIDGAIAMNVYKRAQNLDQWEGEEPAYQGTSVLAGLKAGVERGWYMGYRWAFGLDDLIMGVGYYGPAILGINWYTGMFSSDPDGMIHVTGSVAGGHAILCKGVSVPKRKFRLHNSWGRSFGLKGDCFVSFDDMERLLSEFGEAAFTVPGN